jgi:2'-5' RNA ligase
VSPLPTEMIDRWEHRADQAPGQGLVYWHMLLGGNPEVVEVARTAQERLSAFSGLHMTPLRWLHMTALIAGTADEIPEPDIRKMAEAATRLLATTPPIPVTFAKILYHPEAIMVAATPPDALAPVAEAAKAATREVTGTPGRPGNKLPWTPHITVSYSTAHQDAAPIIDALGRELPGCSVQIAAISLVIQQGPERLWDWQPVATVPLGSRLPEVRCRPNL